MTSKKTASPFFAGTFSSNGDSSSAEEEDDDVFLNSRLDVISRTCDDMDDDGLEYYENPNSSCLLNFKKNANSESSLFTPSPKTEDNAVIFSVHLYGKYYGDVGLFEPDICVLDWRDFKVYIVSWKIYKYLIPIPQYIFYYANTELSWIILHLKNAWPWNMDDPHRLNQICSIFVDLIKENIKSQSNIYLHTSNINKISLKKKWPL